MPAYILLIRDGPVLDAEAMASYRRSQTETRQYGLKPLAVYPEVEAIEGEAPDGFVLLEFPSIEDARGWYHSDQYQAAAKLRLTAAPYRSVIFDGFDPAVPGR